MTTSEKREALVAVGMSTTPTGRHFDKDGQPISFVDWGVLMEDIDYRCIAFTELTDGRHVSTVWLGLDHGFGGTRLIFESLDFPEQEHMERYSTIEEARAGHERLVAELLKKRGPQT